MRQGACSCGECVPVFFCPGEAGLAAFRRGNAAPVLSGLGQRERALRGVRESRFWSSSFADLRCIQKTRNRSVVFARGRNLHGLRFSPRCRSPIAYASGSGAEAASLNDLAGQVALCTIAFTGHFQFAALTLSRHRVPIKKRLPLRRKSFLYGMRHSVFLFHRRRRIFFWQGKRKWGAGLPAARRFPAPESALPCVNPAAESAENRLLINKHTLKI